MTHQDPNDAPKNRPDDGGIGRWLAIAVLLLLPVLAVSAAEDAVGGIRSIIGVDASPRPAVHAAETRDVRSSEGGRLRAEIVATDLDTPWDLAFAPDGSLWFTERGGRVSRLDLVAGAITVLGQIDVHESGEAGLMGMAFHPAFPDSPAVYFAHSYRARSGIRNRLIRATYRNGRLVDSSILLDDIPGRSNHDGSRLAVGPDRMLYMTMGDAGDADAAQERTSLSGKILRLTLDGKPAPGNPFGSVVWSIGHRNPQGLAFMSNGTLYATEHGPGDADEVNLIEPGRNYGWPDVRGDCDSGSEMEFCSEHDVVEPLAEYSPTIGISGLAVYESDRIPGWRGSLVYTSLRGERLMRLALSRDGRTASAQEMIVDGEFGRLRDVVVGPDGMLYVATSNRDGRGRPDARDDRILRIRP